MTDGVPVEGKRRLQIGTVGKEHQANPVTFAAFDEGVGRILDHVKTGRRSAADGEILFGHGTGKVDGHHDVAPFGRQRHFRPHIGRTRQGRDHQQPDERCGSKLPPGCRRPVGPAAQIPRQACEERHLERTAQALVCGLHEIAQQKRQRQKKKGQRPEKGNHPFLLIQAAVSARSASGLKFWLAGGP